MQMPFRRLFGRSCLSYISLQLKTASRAFHSRPQTTQLTDMKVRLVPALQDNYMYLLIDEATKECAAVDPVEPEQVYNGATIVINAIGCLSFPIITGVYDIHYCRNKQLLCAVKEEGATLTSVLTTHHHWDHAGGNAELVKRHGPLCVYGADDRIDELTQKVCHNDILKVGSLEVKCLFTPCHTSGHVCYYIEGGGSVAEPIVFTGDTLFSGGCGRFFEGTPPEMYRALIEVLSVLPDNTRVYCGHEYTLANLKYARHVEPDNSDIQTAINHAQKQRDSNLPTVPTTIAKEKKINPFMRVGAADVQKHAGGLTDPVKVMGYLRTEKDTFKAP